MDSVWIVYGECMPKAFQQKVWKTTFIEENSEKLPNPNGRRN